MATLREKLLASQSANKVQVVDLAEVDEPVYVRVMSGTERDAWEIASFRDGKVLPEHFRAKLVVRCLCDEKGERLFKDEETGLLSDSLPSPAVVKLFDAAHKLNRLSKEDTDELVKNS